MMLYFLIDSMQFTYYGFYTKVIGVCVHGTALKDKHNISMYFH